jgi:hypothetical protein
MNVATENVDEIKPHLIRRTCGGWLAISPRTALFRVGVTAPTENEALERFRFEYSQWIKLFASETLDVPR